MCYIGETIATISQSGTVLDAEEAYLISEKHGNAVQRADLRYKYIFDGPVTHFVERLVAQ